MQTVNYTLTVPSLVSGSTQNSYAVPTITGSASLIITIEGNDLTLSKIRKMVFEFSNDPGKQYTIQVPLTGITTLSGSQIIHSFNSTTLSSYTYTATATAVRKDLTFDYFEIDITVRQASFSNYLGVSTVRTVVFDTPTTTDNLLLVAETNSPKQLVNFVLPGNPIT